MDKDKLKNQVVGAGQKALIATGVFAITQELFSGHISGISVFAIIMFVGFFLPLFFRKKN